MQFTLKRLLASTTLLAIGACGATVPLQMADSYFDRQPLIFQAIAVLLYWNCGAFICGGIGCLFNQTLAGLLLGHVLLIAAMSMI